MLWTNRTINQTYLKLKEEKLNCCDEKKLEEEDGMEF